MPSAIETGETLLADGKVEEAEQSFLEAVREQPDSRAYNNLGVIAFAKKDAQQAVDYFIKAIQLDPANVDAVVNLCDILRPSGSLREVLDLLESLAKNSPENQEIAALLTEARQSKPKPAPPDTTLTNTDRDILCKRVLHGSYEVANQMNTVTGALKQLGMKAETLCYYPSYLDYPADHLLDIAKIENPDDAIAQTREFARKLIDQFDIFHFHSGTTLALDNSDLPLLKNAGKKTLMQYWGSDIRMLSIAKSLNPYARVKRDNEKRIRKHLKTISAYAPVCIVADWELNEYVKDYFEYVYVIPVSIDLQHYRLHENQPDNDRFLIVHAPTSPEIKGTPYIIKAIEDLKSKYSFDFQLVQGLAHKEARAIYEKADLVIDQIHIGSHGLFAVESMALGKPVIVWVSDFMKEKYPPELPLICANPDTIKEQIKRALDNREELRAIGRSGRTYVEKYHDMNKNVRLFMDVYEKLFQ